MAQARTEFENTIHNKTAEEVLHAVRRSENDFMHWRTVLKNQEIPHVEISYERLIGSSQADYFNVLGEIFLGLRGPVQLHKEQSNCGIGVKLQVLPPTCQARISNWMEIQAQLKGTEMDRSCQMLQDYDKVCATIKLSIPEFCCRNFHQNTTSFKKSCQRFPFFAMSENVPLCRQTNDTKRKKWLSTKQLFLTTPIHCVLSEEFFSFVITSLPKFLVFSV